jgi:hypothetical protein
MAQASSETLSPVRSFEGSTTTAARGGADQPVHVVAQSWEMSGPQSRTHAIPLQRFYIAHLLSGAISTTIDGQTTKPSPGAYWPVKAGSTMQIRVLGEYAVVETIAISKQ